MVDSYESDSEPIARIINRFFLLFKFQNVVFFL